MPQPVQVNPTPDVEVEVTEYSSTLQVYEPRLTVTVTEQAMPAIEVLEAESGLAVQIAPVVQAVTVEIADTATTVIQPSPTVEAVQVKVPGPAGPPGPPGPEGPAGTLEGYTLVFLHTQTLASDTWTVDHMLGRIPMAVSIVDSAGNEVIAAIHHTSINQLVASFGSAFSGELRCG